jgi:autotransporter strand-loop-strand O-heptosyltransferase
MKVLLAMGSDSIGDVLSATPIIRKLSKSYGCKIDLATIRPLVFKNNPYINEIYNFKDIDINSNEIINKYTKQHILESFTWNKIVGRTNQDVILKHNMIDLRRYHAFCLGFDLTDEEMGCDFCPDQYKDLNLFSEFVCIHPSQTWESRTWEKNKWDTLLRMLLEAGKKIVIVGKNQEDFEPGEGWNRPKPVFTLDVPEEYSDNVLDLIDKADLSQTWHIIDKSLCLVTMDTGLLHLAGTTDSEIIQLGSSINHKFRAPYRNGRQDYKYKYIRGPCDIACASDPKYALKVHGNIQSMPPLWKCLEVAERDPRADDFKCHPEPKQVYDQIMLYKNRIPPKVNMKKLYLIHAHSVGDILCSTPSIRKLSNAYGEKIDVVTNNAEIFENNPYVNHILSWHQDIKKLKAKYKKGDSHDIVNTYQLNHSFDLRQSHAKYLGFGLLPEEMECDFIPNKYEELNLPISYICIHPAFSWKSRSWPQEKWQELINKLIEIGYKIVIVGKNDDVTEEDGRKVNKTVFEFEENNNLINLANKTNLSQTWHIINRSEKFITMDSGLLHLAGTTNAEIVQLGSSINYKFRAPYRMGSQEYRYTYVGGTCDIFCASDLKYAVKKFGEFNKTPPLWECLEKKDSFECHPSVAKVLSLFLPVKSEMIFNEKKPEKWQKKLGVKKFKAYSFQDNPWQETLWREIIADRGYEKYFQIKEGDVVFDIGANVGYFSLSCSGRNIKHCYSFEPMFRNFQCLKNGISELDDSEKFTLIQKAISPHKEIYVPKSIDQTSPYTEQQKTDNCTSLNTVKLIDFTKENKIKKVDFMKMDIEGGEWDIFESEDFDWILKNTKKFVAEIHIEKEINGNASDHQEKFNIHFMETFKRNGFSTKITSLSGEDVEYSVSNNSFLDDVKKFALDHYTQLIFYAWKEGGEALEHYSIQTSFVDGAFCELIGTFSEKCKIDFIDQNRGNAVIYEARIPSGNWTKPSRRYFTNWRVKVESERTGEIIHDEIFEARGKRVLVHLDSKSLGDNIAWVPYVEEFRKKHDCHLVCSCFKKELFEKSYPDIEFVDPGIDHENLYASYQVGWFDDWTDTNRNPTDPRTIPLQQTATDILGLGHEEIKTKIDIKNPQRPMEEKYVCISTSSTAGCKHWQNPTGWQDTVDYLNNLGFKVVVLQKEALDWMDLQGLDNVEHPNTENIHDVITWLNSCEFFMGLGSGISWLAWGLNKDVVLISGFSKALAEFHTPYRIINEDVCSGCWNNKDHKFDRGDWNWCPEHKNTDKHFECSKSITFEMVKEKIEQILKT